MNQPLAAALLITLLMGCSGGNVGDNNLTPSVDRADDHDGDGISTSDEENIYRSDPNNPNDPVLYGDLDHDRDSIPNGGDADYNGDDDADNDGLSNEWEYSENLNPTEPEILLEEQRFFSTVTTEYSWLKLTLKTPAGDPISGASFTISTDSPALIRAIYPAKGWVSDTNGVIEAPIIALGTGRSNLYLASAEYPDNTIVIEDIDSSVSASTYNPTDLERSYSSIKNDSAPGSGYARSMLQSDAAWTPQSKTTSEWIELPVNDNTRVAAVLIQGRSDAANWVKTLRLSYEIAPGMREYANNGAVFNANVDRNTLVRIPFNAPAGISAIRIHPVTWFLTPALRVALETSADNNTAPINVDSDNDSFNNLLENRLGSDPNDANSPRLHNPDANEREFSSTENAVTKGSDGADGRINAQAWRPAAGDIAPWMNISIPHGSKLVGVALQGDTSSNRWVTSLSYHDSSAPGLVVALQDGDAQLANEDANTIINWWMPENHDVGTLQLQPQTWSNGLGLRAGLWLVDPIPTIADNPHLSDVDGDGLNTLQEQALGLDSTIADMDNDGFSDGQEIANGGDPLSADGDQDGLDDRVELLLGSDPLNANSPGVGDTTDDDTDGINSAYELAVLSTDPTAADTDNDGLSDKEEIEQTFSDPLTADSDGDSLNDGEEFALGSNPIIDSSPVENPLLDADEDGVNAARETQLGTNPFLGDSDGDGLLDSEEHALGSDPLDTDSPTVAGSHDSDNDGLSDAVEQFNNSDMNDANNPVDHGDQDLDNDNTPNGIDPDYLASGDYDGDGINNQTEYLAGSDPTNSHSPQLGGGFDRDNDGIANASDVDFILTATDDTDGDGLRDIEEYISDHSAIDANTPLLGGGNDLDSNSTVNNLDSGYDPNADRDNDSWSNAFEYRSGTNPDSPNTAADFVDPLPVLASPIGSVVKKYNLPDPSTDAPYYSSNPALLSDVEIVSSSPIEASRELRAGFISDDVGYVEIASEGVIINDTPRHFKNLGLRDSSSGVITRVLGDIPPFSQNTLSSTVNNGEVIEPNPLSHILLSELQTLSGIDFTSRVKDGNVDDVQRLMLANKLLMNHPTSWQSFNDYSNSGCSHTICNSVSDASDSLARLFYQQRSVTFAELSENSSYSRLSWADKLALDNASLATHSNYQQARALSLGIDASSGVLEGFADVLDTNNQYSLTDAAVRGTVWKESGVYYDLEVDAVNRLLKLNHYSAQQLATVYFFSEDPGSELVSFTYDATTGKFLMVLTEAQWATGRLALTAEARDGEAASSLLLQWQSSPVSWADEPLSCENSAAAPCHD